MSSSRSHPRRAVLAAVSGIAISIPGCIDRIASSESTEPTESPPMTSDTIDTLPLHDVLKGLLKASDPNTYARERGLDYDPETQTVAVTADLTAPLTDGETPPDAFETTTAAVHDLVEGRVTLEKLPELAEDSTVEFVRPQRPAVQDDLSAGQ